MISRGVAAAVLLLSAAAGAHMMPAQQGTLNVLGDSVFEVVALPVSAFPGVDEDGDGRLSDHEVAAHEAALQAQVGQRYRLFDGDQPGQLELVLVRAEHDERSEESTAGAPTLLVLLKTRFPKAPRELRLQTDLFGAGLAEGQLTIKATRGSEVEAAVLTPLRSEHRFFRAPLQVLGDSVAIGVEHILLGLDHLCFLLTVVVALKSWRTWLAVLTSFTVAHSLTLMATLLSGFTVPSRVVEPAIAASIVGVAFLNLRQASTATGPRVAIVFACGLLHGLGFASSLAGLGLDGAHRALGLLGFNLGIELGQGMFVLAMLALMWALRPLRRQGAVEPLVATAASVVACGVGTLWFIERVLSHP